MWLLLDCSASTALAQGATTGHDSDTVLRAAAQSAAATVLALQAIGVPCAVAAFSSNGRQAVRLSTVKALGQAADDSLTQRLLALRRSGSTRLGAALRHATTRLGGLPGSGRGASHWVLLLSDGQPHDVDVHDRRYLVDDARHAVHHARRRAVRRACLAIGRDAEPDALRIFGRGGTQVLNDTTALPRALRRLIG